MTPPASLHALARIAPDVFWFQLYGLPAEDHRLSFDLIRRAERAGAHALLLTVDVPARQKRVHDVRNGLSVPFRFRPRTVFDIATSPIWALETLRRGQPRFPNFEAYLGEGASTADIAAFVYNSMTGNLTWEVMALFREMNAKGTTVVVATHDRELIRRVGRRVIHLQRGHVAVPA